MSAKPLFIAIGAIGAAALLAGSAVSTQGGFTPLFNGKDLSGWKVPAGDNGHWKVLDGVIDYDAESEAPGDDKALWSEREYGDFVLKVDWRIKSTPYINPNVPIILPSGLHKKDADGKEIRIERSRLRLWDLPARQQQSPGQHLVLADRLRRSLRLSHGRQDAAGRARRRHAETPCRSRHRPMEHVRDHDARRSPHCRARTARRSSATPSSQTCRRAGHRAAAPRLEERRRLGEPAKPGAVQEHFNQRAVTRG